MLSLKDIRDHIPRTKPPHRPDHAPTAQRNSTHPREQPPIADRGDKRLGRHSTHSRENIAHKVVGRDAGGGAAGHELCEHGGGHGENEHGPDAEEEVGDQLGKGLSVTFMFILISIGGTYRYWPYYALFRSPAIPDQSCWVEEGGDPGVFAHAVFGAVDELALVVVALCSLGFPSHDYIRPPTPEKTRKDVTDGVGYVGQADLNGAEIVRWFGEGGFQADVQQIQRAESDGGVVDCDGDGRKAEVKDDLERVEKSALEPLNGSLGFLVDDLPRSRPFQFRWRGLCLPYWYF